MTRRRERPVRRSRELTVRRPPINPRIARRLSLLLLFLAVPALAREAGDAAAADWTKAVADRVAALDDLIAFANARRKAKSEDDIAKILKDAIDEENRAKDAVAQDCPLDTEGKTLADFASAVDAAKQDLSW